MRPFDQTERRRAAPPLRSVKMTGKSSQVGVGGGTGRSVLVSTTRPVPSGRAVQTLPSALTNAIRLPSGDHPASVTVVGNLTGRPPTVTVEVPFETSTVPAG